MEQPPALDLQHVEVRYGKTPVVRGVDLRVEAGRIHGLIGHNGAGKSTLAAVMGGSVKPSAGRITVGGRQRHFRNPRDAERSGIYVVRQERQIFDELSVADNVVISNYPVRGRWPLRAAAKRKARAVAGGLIAELDPGLNVDMSARRASLGQCKLIQIARALYSDARVVVFDEPTAGLENHDVDTILAVIQKYSERGAAIVFVTHKLHEIMRVATDVSVMSDGRISYRGERADLTLDDIVREITHHDHPADYPQDGHNFLNDAPTTSAADDSRAHIRLASVATSSLKPTTLEARAGEVLLLTGADDSGARTIGRVMAGLLPLTTGHVFVGQKEIHPGLRSRFMKAGVGYAPEDRKQTGIFPNLSVEHNIALGRLSIASRFGIVRRRKIRDRSRSLINALDIITESPSTPIRLLSGGNQQKVLVARWLFANSDSIILEEPTHGVDVGAIAAMHRILREATEAGRTIIIVSRESSEFLPIADCTVIFWNGSLVKKVGHGASEREIELAVSGGNS